MIHAGDLVGLVQPEDMGRMNKTERGYYDLLNIRYKAGDILWFAFEPIKFRLARKTYYTPDFIVVNKDREIEVHEVKGFMRDDANVKLKVSNEEYPFKFFLVRLKKGAYSVVEVKT